MDQIKLEKYTTFIIGEIDHNLCSRRISDDSLMQLTTEIRKFKTGVEESDLEPRIKEKVQKLEINYSPKKMERDSLLLLAFVLTFGAWYFVVHYRKQINRKNKLHDLRHLTTEIYKEIHK